MASIGKLERVELREIWKHEEYDFSTWLAQEDNLALLGDTVGLDICLLERESSVGGYSVDIYAEEQGTGKKIIIENQLEFTNHDHLGKIITYASGKDAKYIIWVVKQARDEHRQAIEWLNAHTDSEINFFLLEIELWRIGDSLPAPKFNVVERPNDWVKEEKKSSSQITERGQFCINYWEAFRAHAATNSAFTKEFKLRKTHAASWFDVAIGKSNCFISMNVQPTKSTVDIGIYIPDDKKYYVELAAQSEEIAAMFDCPLEWREASKACRILTTKSIDPTKEENLPIIFDWYIKLAPIFKKVTRL
jgi:hypothetical protein